MKFNHLILATILGVVSYIPQAMASEDDNSFNFWVSECISEFKDVVPCFRGIDGDYYFSSVRFYVSDVGNLSHFCRNNKKYLYLKNTLEVFPLLSHIIQTKNPNPNDTSYFDRDTELDIHKFGALAGDYLCCYKVRLLCCYNVRPLSKNIATLSKVLHSLTQNQYYIYADTLAHYTWNVIQNKNNILSDLSPKDKISVNKALIDLEGEFEISSLVSDAYTPYSYSRCRSLVRDLQHISQADSRPVPHDYRMQPLQAEEVAGLLKKWRAIQQNMPKHPANKSSIRHTNKSNDCVLDFPQPRDPNAASQTVESDYSEFRQKLEKYQDDSRVQQIISDLLNGKWGDLPSEKRAEIEQLVQTQQ